MMHSKNEQIDALDELFKTPRVSFHGRRFAIHTRSRQSLRSVAGRRCSLRDVDQSQTQEEARGSRLTVCCCALLWLACVVPLFMVVLQSQAYGPAHVILLPPRVRPPFVRPLRCLRDAFAPLVLHNGGSVEP